jgi:hypothetical protein
VVTEEMLADLRERRMQALIESNPPAVTGASREELLLAAAYPEAIADAVTSLRAGSRRHGVSNLYPAAYEVAG